jgi:hypothetical protein
MTQPQQWAVLPACMGTRGAQGESTGARGQSTVRACSTVD